VKFYLTG